MSQKIRIVGVIVITLLAAVVFVRTAVYSMFYAPDEEVSFEIPSPSSVPLNYPENSRIPFPSPTANDYPAELQIPSLDVSAKIQHVGIKTNGNMATPSNYTDVGWYKHGTLPGWQGSAVMAGHVDNGLALAGVFKRLSEINHGDEVEVITRGGETLRFIVSDVRYYDYTDVPTDILFNRRDGAWLHLVTCGGEWLPKLKTYEKRLVVFAKLH